MREKIKNLLEIVLAGEWGQPYGTLGGMNTGVIRSANFTKDHKLNDKEIVIRSIPAKKREKKLLKKGDILIENSGGSPNQPVGRVLFYDLEGMHISSNFLSLLRPRSSVDPKFLYYSLCELYDLGIVNFFQQQTTGIINLQLNEYLNETIFCPIFIEQKKIADILSGIDQNINSIDLKIAKLNKKKQAILQSFFIDHNNSNSSYKQLGELAVFHSGRAFKSKELSEKGIKITRISNLHKPDFPYWYYEGDYNPKIIAREGDILFSWAGVANSINIHRYLGEDSLLNQHIYKFQFDDELVKEWSFYYIQYLLPNLRFQIEGGAGQLHLTKGDVQSIQIPFFEKYLMERYVGLLQSIDQILKKYQVKKSKIIDIKSGLSSDLLSGNKRLKI